MDILGLISNVFSGDLSIIILKVVLGLGVSGSLVAFFVWFDRQQKKQAHENTKDGRAADQSTIDDKNKEIFDDAKKSEDEIENIIKKKGM